MIEGLCPGTLILADLGYFGFAWFDRLTQAGYFFVSRMKDKVTYVVEHTLYCGGTSRVYLRDQLVYLGAYRADRAAHVVRLIEITLYGGSNGSNPTRTYRYITNILDPRHLPAELIVELYRRRWDIEQMFNLIKTHLGLSLLFSSYVNVVLQQVYATLIISQIILALRNEVARRAQADVREVSLELLVRWFPRYAQSGRDPVAAFVEDGRLAGFIRPFRGKVFTLPDVNIEDYDIPEIFPPPRTPRYAPPKAGARKTCMPENENSTQLKSKKITKPKPQLT